MSDPETPLVVFRDVDKSYDGQSNAVKGLNLEIARNEFLTLLGPSGSGKTTTLMMLAGFEPPTAGSITFDGAPITDVPTYQRDFGLVFQNYALFPHMTVAENLAFPLRMRKLARSAIAERVARTLDIVRLGAYADRKPAQLSGGQAQRVALARAIVFNPRMVLMDEPLGALDRQLRDHMQQEIKRLHQELNITLLYVTHDQSEALTMSDRVAVFDRGKIQQAGTPEQIYARPANRFVAGFMGENNALDAEVVTTGAQGIHQVRLLDFDQEMLASSETPLRPGQRVTVMIRPECVALVPPGQDNSLAAGLRDTVYHGDHRRLVIGGRNGAAITLRVPHSGAGSALSPGDRVHLHWPARSALIFGD